MINLLWGGKHFSNALQAEKVAASLISWIDIIRATSITYEIIVQEQLGLAIEDMRKFGLDGFTNGFGVDWVVCIFQRTIWGVSAYSRLDVYTSG